MYRPKALCHTTHTEPIIGSLINFINYKHVQLKLRIIILFDFFFQFSSSSSIASYILISYLHLLLNVIINSLKVWEGITTGKK